MSITEILFYVDYDISLINCVDYGNEQTVLMAACAANDIEIVDELIKRGAYINHRDYYGSTALIFACEENNERIVDLLIRAGAQLDIRGESDYTALMWACKNNNERIVDLLIQAGVDLDKQGCCKYTALMHACEYPRIVKKLIDAGCDINLKNDAGKTALDIAKNNSYYNSEKLLQAEAVKK